MTPSITVIIPSYNYEHYITEAIQSILSQSYQDFEVLIVDDGSTDNTEKIISNIVSQKIRYIKTEHLGVAHARNVGIQNSKGSYIAWLDADDLWVQEKLEKQMDYLSHHGDCEVVFCACKNFADEDYANLTQRQRELLSADVSYVFPSGLYRKGLFAKVGLLSENLGYAEDTEWYLRSQVLGINMKHRLDVPYYLRRIHNSNLSQSHEKVTNSLKFAAQAMRRAMKKNKLTGEKS